MQRREMQQNILMIAKMKGLMFIFVGNSEGSEKILNPSEVGSHQRFSSRSILWGNRIKHGCGPIPDIVIRQVQITCANRW